MSTIEHHYTDLATIKRHQEHKERGETLLSLAVLYTDQPCRISQIGLGKNNQSYAQNDIRYDAKLFISPTLIVKQGDVIEVTRDEKTVFYTAGEPFRYGQHQEILLSREGYA